VRGLDGQETRIQSLRLTQNNRRHPRPSHGSHRLTDREKRGFILGFILAVTKRGAHWHNIPHSRYFYSLLVVSMAV
jgi:hypothetical protein